MATHVNVRPRLANDAATPGDGSTCASKIREVRRTVSAVVAMLVVMLALPATAAGDTTSSSWRIQPTPNAGSLGTVLNAVACSSAKACTAVGYYEGYFGLRSLGGGPPSQIPFAEQWDGTSWTTTFPSQKGIGDSGAELTGVACSSAKACTAVGYYEGYFGLRSLGGGPPSQIPFAEQWDGTSWTTTFPSQKGIGDSGAELTGVACSSAKACTAVGYYEGYFGLRSLGGGPPSQIPFAEQWDGTSWTTTFPSQKGIGDSGAELTGVACSSAKACTAVGYYEGYFGLRSLGGGPPSQIPFAEQWDGTSWTTTFPSQKGIGDSGAELTGVACSSAKACTAVGYYEGYFGLRSLGGGPPSQIPFAEQWDGTSWTTTFPSQKGIGDSGAELTGVACSSAKACTAVGYYEGYFGLRSLGGGPPSQIPFAEQWDGTSWTTTFPSQKGIGDSGAELTGVACSSAKACTAVGYYEGSSGHQSTLAETYAPVPPSRPPAPRPPRPTTPTRPTTPPRTVTPGHNSPEAAVDGLISDEMAGNFDGACGYFEPDFQPECQAFSGAESAVTGTFSIAGQAIQGTDALVSIVGSECQSGSGCSSNSDPTTGMPPGAGTFASTYATALNDASLDNPTMTFSPVACTEINGQWFVAVGGGGSNTGTTGNTGTGTTGTTGDTGNSGATNNSGNSGAGNSGTG